ncbi:meiosis-specific nuclear structural protein 1 isoform X2 [Rhinatrema bivittatum]|nr:meiosis-specific nuclear structural protein 1 isoform X2 [Rhinatrema bivittatum]XP_029431181.1 meiosis-specific nuclear structural protein 1 isoform X2 [Rhinatrema bivittatum]
MEESIEKAEIAKRVKELQLEQEERMAREMARIKHEKLKDEKIRQLIRENSSELRELEIRLNSAYLNKARAAQVAEKEAIKYEEMRQDSELARKMKEMFEKETEEEHFKEKKHYEDKINYQQGLERQLEENEQKKQKAYEQFLNDKLLIDQIVRKIYEEDQVEKQRKLEKISSTQRYIEEFKQEQADWRRKERERMEEENRRILKFANMKEKREADRMAGVQENEAKKLVLQNQLMEHIEKEQQKRDEFEKMQAEFCREEQAEAARLKEIEEMEKKIRQRLELQKNFHEQMAYKHFEKKKAKEEEEAFRQAMLAKFAEEDRLEQMNAQKRRMKLLEHKRAVEKLIEDRHLEFLAEKERELEERKEEERREALRHAIIEDERQKLLKLHASKLLGYLPKGVFKDEEDLKLFDEDFQKIFQKKRADIFTDEDWD